MHCLDEVPAPESVPPVPDTPHTIPGAPPPPLPVVPPGDDDDDTMPPPVQLPGRPGVPERVAFWGYSAGCPRPGAAPLARR